MTKCFCADRRGVAATLWPLTAIQHVELMHYGNDLEEFDKQATYTSSTILVLTYILGKQFINLKEGHTQVETISHG
jgi:hypothetical protein